MLTLSVAEYVGVDIVREYNKGTLKFDDFPEDWISRMDCIDIAMAESMNLGLTKHIAEALEKETEDNHPLLDGLAAQEQYQWDFIYATVPPLCEVDVIRNHPKFIAAKEHIDAVRAKRQKGE